MKRKYIKPVIMTINVECNLLAGSFNGGSQDDPKTSPQRYYDIGDDEEIIF